MTDTVAQFIAAGIVFAVAGAAFALGYRLGQRRGMTDATEDRPRRRTTGKKPGDPLLFRPPKPPSVVH